MSTSKTGKHGHAKVNLVAIDVSLVSLSSAPAGIRPACPASAAARRESMKFGEGGKLI